MYTTPLFNRLFRTVVPHSLHTDDASQAETHKPGNLPTGLKGRRRAHHSVKAVTLLGLLACGGKSAAAAQQHTNVLFIIADDFTAEALGCYGNTVCHTPNIDKLASEGVRYTHTYCQYAVCGPSRASFMFSYYPHTTGVFGYESGRAGNGNATRETWSEYFKNRGYYSARVSKIYHMAVPNDIINGNNGTDDAQSWTERFNAQGGEAAATFAASNIAPGTVSGWASKAERLQGYNNANGVFPGVDAIIGGNTYEYVITPEEDPNLPWDDPSNNQQSDGKTAKIACDLIEQHANEPFFIAVGFVRPHIPFVAPKSYFEMYPWTNMVPPTVPAGDQDDMVWTGVTTASKKFNDDEKKKAIAGYYACTTYMDHQVGKVLQKLEDEGLEDHTIVIFTSDHGFFLGEHDLW
jgi:arylsulfatase A-like enzyme